MNYSAIGFTDSVTKCDCCGKENLKRTTVLLDNKLEDYIFVGSECALKLTTRTNLKSKKATQKLLIEHLSLGGLDIKIVANLSTELILVNNFEITIQQAIKLYDLVLSPAIKKILKKLIG